jgi:hypothetical protein
MPAFDPHSLTDIRERFVREAHFMYRRAPLYARLCRGISADGPLARMLFHAPPTQRLPVLLLAAVHHLLLAEPDAELGMWYPNLVLVPRDDDPMPAFREFVQQREGELVALLSTRSTQTNEVGRATALLPVLGMLGHECGPLAMLDVGTSAGLVTLLDHFEYRYQPGGTVGGPSSVVLTCRTTGDVPVPTTMPTIVARLGIDRSPIDVADATEARWLEACVWPDQAERFHRLEAAIELARQQPPHVRAGDAVDDLATAVGDVASSGGHPVVTNSWVLHYLTSDERRAYLDVLEAIGAGRDLSWVFVEEHSSVPELPILAPDDPDVRLTFVTLVRWRNGVRAVSQLAAAHPHGFSLRWR